MNNKKVSMYIKRNSAPKMYRTLVCEYIGVIDDTHIFETKNPRPIHRVKQDVNRDDNSVTVTHVDDSKFSISCTQERLKWWRTDHEVQLFGQSNDIINVEGDVRDSFTPLYNEPTRLDINGVIVSVEYTGEWKFEVLDRQNAVSVEQYSSGSKISNQYNDYTELLCVGFDDPIRNIGIID